MASSQEQRCIHKGRGGVTILLVMLPLVVGAGVLLDPFGSTLGHPLGEAASHLWVQDLIQRAVWEGRHPFHHPDSIMQQDLWLYPTDIAGRLVCALFGGGVFAFNVLALGLLALASFAGAGLAREAGAGPWGSVVAGAMLALHPSLTGFLADGRLDSRPPDMALLSGGGFGPLDGVAQT